MGNYLLSIDNGLTAIKVALFDLAGREIKVVSARTPHCAEEGRSEIDMAELWDLTADLIRAIMQTAAIRAEEIVGIGNSGHGGGVYLLDLQHQPVRRAITSMDARALPLLALWQSQGLGTRDILHQELWGGQAIPLLVWLKQHEPEQWRRTAWVLSAKDWLIERLTGQIGMEWSDGSNSGLISPVSRRIEPSLLARFGLADGLGKMPPIRTSTGIAGRITVEAAKRTGLAAGTPVAGGAFDCAACAIGSGMAGCRKYSLVAGTWNINGVTDPHLLPTNGTTKCSLFPDGQQYFFVESSATSAVNLDWFIRQVLQPMQSPQANDQQIYEQLNAWVASVHPTDSDLLYLPFLYPAGLADSLAGAGWINLRPEHALRHMVTAIYEGVVFAHRLHLEKLQTAGLARDSIILTGGAANSAVWCRIFADVMGLPVFTTETSQTGALGAAICTSVAIGYDPDLTAATDRMVRFRTTYQPDRERQLVYDQKFQRFKQTIKHLEQPIN